VPAGFSDEIKYIAPLTAAGIILLSGRADRRQRRRAGLGGAALEELFDDYTAPRHRTTSLRRSTRERPS
jgi:hypothetical protein